ncbi:neuronal acetylcholine receptor subunit beta-3-like [Saccostrea echinata]|uniref:neuronal acetylcholine receptor subunit beta-3-like n=1 Tax=Saccostrea echinata TaxID=191078 RepID=UPI002A81F476|nr:neuronal acetylcholine receptor subunit beta-3-like [Saccostrea echinata]
MADKCFFSLVVLTFCCITLVLSNTPTKFKTWLGSEPYLSYNKRIFPRSNQNDNVTVEIKYYLIAINGFDEVAGQMETAGYMKVKWNTELLTWSSTDIPSITLPQDNFWLPSLVVSNSVNSLFELGHKSYPVRIDSNGDCEWTVGIVAKTACAVDVSYYPFDVQSCKVTLNPWGFNDNQIYLMSTETTIDLTHYMENVQWEIVQTSVVSKSVSSTSFLNLQIEMKRRPGYFIVNMVIPILILGLLNGLVFLLPADSGERVGFAITAFLTFAVFLTMVSANLPKASEPMSLLCYFLTLMLIMSALSCVITIMTLRVYHQDEGSEVPKWLRNVVCFLNFEKFKKWFCSSKGSKNSIHADNDDLDDDDDEMAPPLQRKTGFDDEKSEASSEDTKEEEEDDTAHVTWIKVGKTLDIFFFTLFVLGTVIITVFFLDYLWKPSLVLSNSVESLKELGDQSYRIRIDNYGNHEWVVGIVSKTACSVDITYYPFDKQSCNITFNPWGYTQDQIDLVTENTEVDLTHYQENVEWTIASTVVDKLILHNNVYLNFVLKLERKPGYFIINMIIPILILSLLNGLVFLLPADSGERVGYAITAFLTFAVFLSMVSENLPKASEPMSMLCYFLTLMLCLSALSTIITILILRVHHQHEDSECPKFLRHIIAFIKCDKCKKWCCTPKKVKEINPDDEEEEEDELGENPDDTKHITWKVAARVLDYFFFLVFLGATSAISVLFLIPLAMAG